MTSNEPLDSRYLDWLYSQLAPVRNRNPAHSYWHLVETIFRIEFLWSVPNDDNRIEDGLELRGEFLTAIKEEGDEQFLTIGCSVLEMFVALCRRAEFESTHDVYWWFRRILDNLNLGPFVDDQFDDQVRMVIQDAFQVVINRSYRHDGVGGMFPLRGTDQDQRELELWYQMSSYILENDVF